MSTKSVVVERAKKMRAEAPAAEVVQTPAEVPAPVPSPVAEVPAPAPVAADPVVKDAEQAVADFQVLEQQIETIQNQLDELEGKREEFYAKFKGYGEQIAKADAISAEGVKKLVDEFSEKFVETAGSLVGPMLRPMLRLDTFVYEVDEVQHGFSDNVVSVVRDTVGINSEIDYKPVMDALKAHIATATANDPTIAGIVLRTKIAWEQSKRIASGAATAAGSGSGSGRGKMDVLAFGRFEHPDYTVDSDDERASFKIYKSAAGKIVLSKHDKNWGGYCKASGCADNAENYNIVLSLAKEWAREWAEQNGKKIEVWKV